MKGCVQLQQFVKASSKKILSTVRRREFKHNTLLILDFMVGCRTISINNPDS
jgi:hypothetical protein